MSIQAPRGTKDVLPGDSHKWHFVERAVREVAELFGYDEIRTPMFESSALFKRGVGEETDIVSKEMYLFQDKGGDEFALRPELTAPVVRAAIENNLITGQAPCARLYYNSAANFRYEKPQLGRQRQFHQFGTELLGPSGPAADAETILFAIAVYRKLGLSGFEVRLNSLASKEARGVWREKLVAYLESHLSDLSEESQRRVKTNPMRVLDSKDRADKQIVRNAPIILEHLSEEDKIHFDTVKELLTASDVRFTVDPLLVRGLDYYTRTVFELTSSDLGSQDALCGGGRYDLLIEQLDGPPTPAVGFAAGVERAIIVLDKLRGGSFPTPRLDAYIVAQSEGARAKCFQLADELRSAGKSAVIDLQNRSMKAQMREANRLETRNVIIIGDQEIVAQEAQLKRMDTGEQKSVPLTDLTNLMLTDLGHEARAAALKA
jgi:histidyl-tRNA synthetase